MKLKRQLEEKPKKSIMPVIVSIFLLAFGILLMFNKPIRNQVIAKKIDEHKITNVSKKEIKENQKSQDATFDFDEVQSVSSEEVLQDLINNSPSPSSFITVAGIAIPDLEMNLPIYKGVDDTSLVYGAGTMKPNQELGKGNYALASHSMFGYAGADKLLFSPLARAKKGMMIYLTDLTNVYTYEITSVEVVTPDSGYVIDDVAGKTEVTLVTCTDADATNRIIVKGTYRTHTSFQNADQNIIDAFNHSYTGAS